MCDAQGKAAVRFPLVPIEDEQGAACMMPCSVASTVLPIKGLDVNGVFGAEYTPPAAPRICVHLCERTDARHSDRAIRHAHTQHPA